MTDHFYVAPPHDGLPQPRSQRWLARRRFAARSVATALFSIAGGINLFDRTDREDFVRWGYPAGAQVATGLAEWGGAAALWRRDREWIGYATLGTVMAGACLTLLRAKEYRRLPLALAFGTAIATAAAIDRQ